ncbi:MAG: Rpn family recombination-promoting nuclease/putative transposase [Methanobrevibacter sp.]|jgi:predicted transposase/invertase (TIGR01784 family)|nr:Rpn family recombination-promoting nuclease/putative transposase [Candidatus Methanovirga meridionalis]
MIKKDEDIDILKNFIFKLVFGRIASRELLEDFLERILGTKVEIEQIANNEIVRETSNFKNLNLDLVIITKEDHIISIEVQDEPIYGMQNRIQGYSSGLGSVLLKRGDEYFIFEKVICVAILNHKLYKQKKNEYVHRFRIVNTEDYSIFGDDLLEIIFFDKMKKENFNINDPLDHLFMYLYGLLTDDELTTVFAEDSLIRKIEEAKNMISKSEEAEILKVEIEKREMDEKVRLIIAKEEGIKEGVEKEKINLALKLKNKGFSLEEISEITELSFEKIEKLISNT